MMRSVLLAAGAVVCLMASGASWAGDICAEPVETPYGMVRGTSETGSSTCVWRGIPYAAAPVGDLRWRAPRQTPEWDGVFEATQFGDRCLQAGGMLGGGGAPGVGMSEDCLNLNIWRPKKSGRFPVMFWVHGGGYYVGSGSDPQYWGDRLAEAGEVVMVTINYRLSLLGFMAHPGLRAEDPDKATGGYGTLDQVFALRWVRENISGFGGDPDNITIFGQSAGGCSVCTLLATPLTRGLFHRAIMQSGICELSRDLDSGYEQARGAMEKFGCDFDDLECMRSISAEKITAQAGGSLMAGFVYVPCHDGHLLRDTPLGMIRDGDYNRVPVMAGTVLDEFGKAVKLKPKYYFTRPAGYQEKLAKGFDMTEADARKLVELYPLEAYNRRPVEAMGRMLGADATMQCPTHRLLAAVAEDGPEAYFYRFDYNNMKYGKYLGSYHTAELPFLFDSFDRPPAAMFYNDGKREETRELTRIMQGYWSNFARNGDPNGPGLPDWAAFTNGDQLLQVLDTSGAETGPAGVEERCEFWDGYGGEFLPFANDLVERIF